MTAAYAELSRRLAEKGMRPSHQRVMIYQYLNAYPCHPTAEMIYQALHQKVPTLSRATVYNTLKALEKAGLIREVGIEDNEIRYDIVMEDHGHFKCETCGDIYNFDIQIDSGSLKELHGFAVASRDVYLKGICLACLEHRKPKGEGG